MSECVNMRVADVLADGVMLAIRHSKGDADQLVYMVPDVVEAMGSYLEDVSCELGHENEWVLPGANHSRHVRKSVFCKKFSIFRC